MIAEVADSGIDVTELSDEEVYSHWRKLCENHHREKWVSEGYSPEEVDQKMVEYLKERG